MTRKPSRPVGLTSPPAGYAGWLAKLKTRIHSAQQRAALAVNRELVLLYWQIGRDIRARQAEQGWGAKVIERLSRDLRAAFPDMQGFSPRNLKYMRAFAEAWLDEQFVQGVLAQLPWYHQLALLDKLHDPETRKWYAASKTTGRATCWRCRSKPVCWNAAARPSRTFRLRCPSRNLTSRGKR